MSPTEQFGLNWLLNAMTCQSNYQHYYYDSIKLRLFHITLPDDRDGPILFYDALGISLEENTYHELFMRMENCNGACSGIVEICRFSRVQKVDIQQQFMSRFNQFRFLTKMTDEQGEGPFILDEILAKPPYVGMEGIWGKFKLEVARYYIQQLSLVTGIQVDLSR